MVEYGVVGLLVLILLALISMGVLRSRETARDHLCRRRLVLLSRAVTDFVDDHVDYPGYIGPNESSQDQSISWVALTLPYLQDRLPVLLATEDGWKVPEQPQDAQLEQKRPWPEWKKALTSTVPFLLCPAEDTERQKPGISSYVASCGYVDAPERADQADFPANGVFLDRRRGPPLSERQLQDWDGTEFTVLLSENVQSGSWDSGNEPEVGFVWTEGLVKPEKRNVEEPEVFALNHGARGGPLGYKTARPSSHHAGGVHVSFANTRIAKLATNIDPIVYIRLCTPNDTKLVNPWTKTEIGPPIGREPSTALAK